MGWLWIVAAVALGQVDGRQASVVQLQPDARAVRAGQVTAGLGQVALGARDAITDASSNAGDQATLGARVVAGPDRYDVELVSTGITAPRAPSSNANEPPPPGFGYSIGGGVELDTDVFGPTGVGPRALAQAHAAVAVFGAAKVWKNGRLLSSEARLAAFALATGDADLPAGSLALFIDGLPRASEANGQIELVFPRVAIDVNGQAIAPAPFVEEQGEDLSGLGGSGSAGQMAPAYAPTAYVSALALTGGALPTPPPAVAVPSRDLPEAIAGRNLNPTAPSQTGPIFLTPSATSAAQTQVAVNSLSIAPGAPMAGTPSAPVAGTPSAPISTRIVGPATQAAAGPFASQFPAGNFPGSAAALSTQLVPAGSALGSASFASPGIPLAPPPANAAAGTPLIQTPAPFNILSATPSAVSAAPAALPSTPTPLSSASR